MDPIDPDVSLTVSQATALIDAAVASHAPPSFNPHHPAVDCLPFKPGTNTHRVALEMARRLRVKYTSEEWVQVTQVRNASAFYAHIAKRMVDAPYQVYKDDTLSPPRYYMDANTGPSNLHASSSSSSNKDADMSESDGEEEAEDEDDTNTHWEAIRHLVEHRAYGRVVRYMALNFGTWVSSASVTKATGMTSEDVGLSRYQPKINGVLKDTQYTVTKKPMQQGGRCYLYMLTHKPAKAPKAPKAPKSEPIVEPKKSSSSSSSTAPPLSTWSEDMVANKLFEELPFLRDNEEFVQTIKSRRIKGKDLLMDSVRSSERLGYLLGMDDLQSWKPIKCAVMREQIYERVQEWKRI